MPRFAREGGEGRSSLETVRGLWGDARAPAKAKGGDSGGAAWVQGCSAQGGGCRCLGSGACARPVEKIKGRWRRMLWSCEAWWVRMGVLLWLGAEVGRRCVAEGVL